jgi:prophage regulatory protein
MGAKAEQSTKRTIRRYELRQIVPLADTTIYEMERRGEFPRRFALTARCVVWDLAEIEAWLAERRRASDSASTRRAPHPNVHQRRTRPVKARSREPGAASTAG